MSSRTLSPKSRRPKAEVDLEFGQIRRAVEKEQEENSPAQEEFAKLREAEVKAVTQGMTVESVVQRMSGIDIEVTRVLSNLTTQLLSETKTLNAVREAVQLEKSELERLHKIDIAKTSLDQMVQEYAELSARLIKESDDLRLQWQNEQTEHEKTQKQTEEDLKRARLREKEEYEYEHELEQKKQREDFAEAMRLQERQNKEQQETLTKSWAEREASLKEQEQELQRLRKESADFPERIKKEVERAVAESAKTLNTNHQQAFVLAQKDIEAEKRLADVRVQSLNETVARQAEEIKNLALRLDEAKRQVQEIAMQAIESASGSKALSHVNQIAMEQAKTRTQQS